MLLLAPIWNSKSEATPADLLPETAAEYRWQYNVCISRVKAERVSQLLWKAARREALPGNSAAPRDADFTAARDAARVVLELAELWDVIVQRL